jgi:hypothetical protein
MTIDGVRLPWRGVLAALVALPVVLGFLALLFAAGPQ